MSNTHKRGGKRPGSGRPQGIETTGITFRISRADKKELKKRYPDLSKKFRQFVNSLLESI